MAEKAEEKLTFEQSLEKLEQIVKSLEKGDAPLAESLELFEQGALLVKNCTKMLEEAEQKVTKLQKGPDGAPEETPYF